MGVYYSWVNMDRREFIQCGDFDDSRCKLYQTIWYDCMGLRAFCTLLNKEWRGQRIIYLGDEWEPEGDHGNSTVAQLIEEHRIWNQPGYLFDYVEENFHDITPVFAETEDSLRSEIEYVLEAQKDERNPYRDYDPYHVDPKDPFHGLFERKLIDFRYVVNETKGEFLDREKAQNSKGHLVNPLPLLLAYVPFEEEPFLGKWIGDRLWTTDELPPGELKDMTDIYLVDF